MTKKKTAVVPASELEMFIEKRRTRLEGLKAQKQGLMQKVAQAEGQIQNWTKQKDTMMNELVGLTARIDEVSSELPKEDI